MLFVSHNMPAVEAFCSGALLLSAGQVAKDRPVGEVITSYHAMTSARGNREPFNPAFRRGTSPVFVSASLIDDEGRDTSQLIVGGRFVIEMGVRPQQQLLSPSIGIGIDDVMGRRMLTLHNPLRGARRH